MTRSREQASELSAKLKAAGWEVVEFPTIKIAPLKSYRKLDKAVSKLADYQWVVFTSQNAVDYFFLRMSERGLPPTVKVAAIGPGTKSRLAVHGVPTTLIADEFRAEGIIKKFPKKLGGVRLLIPRAQKARETLPEELRKRGARVDVIPAYRTVLPRSGSRQVRELIKSGAIDLITFTSSSTVENFVKIVGKSFVPQLKKVKIASIGPITTASAKKLKLKVACQAKQYTIDGLVQAIKKL